MFFALLEGLQFEFWKTKNVSEITEHTFLIYQNIVLDDRVPLSYFKWLSGGWINQKNYKD